jgi:RNA polymerase sigma-70 factor (ECF subfamily)
MPDTSDAELWARARAGDTEAFGDLYERHARAIQSYCLWRTADPQAAEDATATVFLEAWRRCEGLTLLTDSAAPLLLGIANNVVRRQWRKSRRQRDALERVHAAEATGASDLEAEAIVRLDAARELREAGATIRSLPRREREVLAMVAWGELSYEETAVALGIPIGTVRSRLARARRRLSVSGQQIVTPIAEEEPSP